MSRLEEQFNLTSEVFTKEINRLVFESLGGLNYLEAIVVFCTEKEIPIEDIIKLIPNDIRIKLRQIGEDLHLGTEFRRKRARLPI